MLYSLAAAVLLFVVVELTKRAGKLTWSVMLVLITTLLVIAWMPWPFALLLLPAWLSIFKRPVF
jgi:hypothetical protein